jgi:hypothetical protein
MVLFVNPNTVKTVIVEMSNEAAKVIHINQVIWILHHLGHKLTKKSRDYLERFLKDKKGSFFELQILELTQPEIIKVAKNHKIPETSIPSKVEVIKIDMSGKSLVAWFKTDRKVKEWTLIESFRK